MIKNDGITNDIKELKEKLSDNIENLVFIDDDKVKKLDFLKTNSTEIQVFSGMYGDINISIKEFSALKVKNRIFDNFLQEINTACKTIHPNVPKFYGVGFNNTKIYLIYDLIKGESLKKKCESLNLKEKLNMLIQAVKIITDLHKQDIAHKGLRTNKFIVDNTNKIFLKDLGEINYEKGTSEANMSSEETNNWCVYYAPEYFNHEDEDSNDEDETEESIKKYNELNAKFDIWSLGCIISEICSGVIPWTNYSNTGKSSKVKVMSYLLDKKNFPIPEIIINEFKELSDILKCCLKINAEERIKSSELLEKLEKYYNSL